MFCWLLAPIFSSYYLSRTGRYERAHLISSLALTALVTAVAAGGIASVAAIWFVVVPLEATLSGSRRVVRVASLIALVAAGLLLFMSVAAITPEPEQDIGALAALGVVSASLYATGLALGAELFARADFSLLYSEEDGYRLLARRMTDVICRHRGDGTVVFLSPAAKRLLGASAVALHGHGLFDRVHIADRPAYLSALAAAARGEACSVEFRARRECGDPAAPPRFIWIEMRCGPLDHPAAGSAEDKREVVSVLRDITERKARENEREGACAEAERANADRDRILAVMSHELRTPLNAIIGFSDLLRNERDGAYGPDRRKEYARLVAESGHHMLAMVNDVLAMATLETGAFKISPEPFQVLSAIASCCDLLALKASERGIRLHRDADADLPPINADKRAIKQILINLLSNAIKFTDRGGRVTVGAKRDGAHLLIFVEDNGIGIRKDDLPRLGEPFFRSGARDRRVDGTGLGLAIVKGLVALHGGDLSIASRIGAGARVSVRIPFEAAKGGKPPSVKSSATITRLATSADAASETSNSVKKRA